MQTKRKRVLNCFLFLDFTALLWGYLLISDLLYLMLFTKKRVSGCQYPTAHKKPFG